MVCEEKIRFFNREKKDYLLLSRICKQKESQGRIGGTIYHLFTASTMGCFREKLGKVIIIMAQLLRKNRANSFERRR